MKIRLVSALLLFAFINISCKAPDNESSLNNVQKKDHIKGVSIHNIELNMDKKLAKEDALENAKYYYEEDLRDFKNFIATDFKKRTPDFEVIKKRELDWVEENWLKIESWDLKSHKPHFDEIFAMNAQLRYMNKTIDYNLSDIDIFVKKREVKRSPEGKIIQIKIMYDVNIKNDLEIAVKKPGVSSIELPRSFHYKELLSQYESNKECFDNTAVKSIVKSSFSTNYWLRDSFKYFDRSLCVKPLNNMKKYSVRKL